MKKNKILVFVSFICIFTLGFTSTCFAETASSNVQKNAVLTNQQQLEQLESNITLAQKQSFDEMSISQKEAKTLDISNKYFVGEKLSDDDASFLLLHEKENTVTEKIAASSISGPITRTSGSNAYIYVK